jgi:hypothetical protein
MNNIEPWEIWELPGGCHLYLHSRFVQLPEKDDLVIIPRKRQEGQGGGTSACPPPARPARRDSATDLARAAAQRGDIIPWMVHKCFRSAGDATLTRHATRFRA